MVAVSGGADSVCLAHLVARAMGTLRMRPLIGHVDHGLRAASAADARSVVELSERLGLPVVVRNVEVAGVDRRRHGLESAARDARYGALAAIAHEHRARFILTAHTRDDNVETILMRILRGTGTLGLRGIEASAPLSADPALRIARPLLAVATAQTRDHCVSEGLEWRVDESNANTSLMRNRVRLHLLPLLRTYNPAIDEALLRLAAAARDDNEWMEMATARRSRTALRATPEAVSVTLDRAPRALRHRLVRAALREALGGSTDVGDVAVERLAAAVGHGRRVRLPGGVVAEARAGTVVIPRAGPG